jgi:hypothetical protein
MGSRRKGNAIKQVRRQQGTCTVMDQQNLAIGGVHAGGHGVLPTSTSRHNRCRYVAKP